MGDYPALKYILFILLSGETITSAQRDFLGIRGEEWESKSVLMRRPLSYLPCINGDCDSLAEIRNKDNQHYIDCSTCGSVAPIANEERYGWKANIGLLVSILLKEVIMFPQLEPWQGLESIWKLGSSQGVTILFSIQKLPQSDNNSALTITLERGSTDVLCIFDFVHISDSTITIDSATLDLKIAQIKGQVLGDTPLTISYGLWRVTYTTPKHETITGIYYGDDEIYSSQTLDKNVRPNDWKGLGILIKAKGNLCTYEKFYDTMSGNEYDAMDNTHTKYNHDAKHRLSLNPFIKGKINTQRNQGYILME